MCLEGNNMANKEDAPGDNPVIRALRQRLTKSREAKDEMMAAKRESKFLRIRLRLVESDATKLRSRLRLVESDATNLRDRLRFVESEMSGLRDRLHHAFKSLKRIKKRAK